MMRDFLATEGGQLCKGGVASSVISEQGGARWHGYIVIIQERVTRNIYVIEILDKYLHEKSCNVRVINLLFSPGLAMLLTISD